MKGMLPEADDFRASLGLPPLTEEEKRLRRMKENPPTISSVMQEAQHRLYAEMRQYDRTQSEEDELDARYNYHYGKRPERYLTEEDLMDEAIQDHIRHRARCRVFGNMPSSEGIHRYAIGVPHAVPGRSSKNRERNRLKDEAITSIRNLGGRIFFVDEYPLGENYMKIVYLYIIGYPTYFTGFGF